MTLRDTAALEAALPGGGRGMAPEVAAALSALLPGCASPVQLTKCLVGAVWQRHRAIGWMLE